MITNEFHFLGTNFLLNVAIVTLNFGCSIDHESSIGKFGKEANFPMYYLSGGEAAGTGSLFRVNEVSIGQAVSSEQVLSGLTAPTGITQDGAGNIFITESRAFPNGKVKRMAAGQSNASDFITELDYPTGVATDTFNQLYVVENGKKRILRYKASGELELFKSTDVGFPESATIDDKDNLFLVESSPSLISKIGPNQEREVLIAEINGVYKMAVGASGAIFILVVDAVSGTGKVLKVTGLNTTEVVVSDLVNPTSIAFDSANALYISEGAPANRISRYALGDFVRRVIVTTSEEPNEILFTPF